MDLQPGSANYRPNGDTGLLVQTFKAEVELSRVWEAERNAPDDGFGLMSGRGSVELRSCETTRSAVLSAVLSAGVPMPADTLRATRKSSSIGASMIGKRQREPVRSSNRRFVWLSAPCELLWQDFGEEANPVAVHDGADVGFRVAAAVEDVGELLKVADAIEVCGCLFDAVTAVEVTADADV